MLLRTLLEFLLTVTIQNSLCEYSASDIAKRSGYCNADIDCAPHQSCNNHSCETVCPGSCGPNTDCRPMDGIPYCYCWPEYRFVEGLGCRPFDIIEQPPTTPPPTKPEPGSCGGNSDCPTDRTCQEGKCVNPCNDYRCDAGTICYAQDNKPLCLSVRAGNMEGGSSSSKSHFKKTFYLSESKVTWLEALRYCWDRGMTLLSVESAEENIQLKRFLEDRGFRLGVWIGGRDYTGSAKKEAFLWTETATRVQFADWGKNHPKKDRDCISLSTAEPTNHKWGSFNCTNQASFVCQYYTFS